MTSRRSLARRAARLLVRVAALRAPVARRDRMRREWEAELEREFAGGREWSALGAAWGAFADAEATRRIDQRGERTMTTTEWTSGLRRDLALSIRGLARSPGFTAVAVLTLAMGLGGSAAIYTLLDRVAFDPLPYPEPGRLVRLENQVPGVGPDEAWSLSTAQYVYLTEHARTLESVGLFRGGGGNVTTAVGPRRARLAMVTASMMPLIGAEAHLGRVITPADDEPGGDPLVLLSYGFWTRFMGADPDIVGRTLPFNDLPIEIIGVLEPGAELPGWLPSEAPDIWMPMRVNRATGFSNNHVFPAIARLAEGETTVSAETEIDGLTPRLAETYPNVYTQRFFDQYGFRTTVTPLKESVIGDLARNLWVLFGGIGLVLLIASANVANLFLVRVEARRREIDIRTALGAGRATIARYLVSEAMTLGLLGGVLALGVCFWAVPALTTLAPELPRVADARIDAETVLFTLGLAVVVGLVIATFPLLGPAAPAASLGDGSRSSTSGPGRSRVRSALVVSQMALAVTLLVGAGLLVQGLRALQAADTGMDPEGAVAVDLYMNPHTHGTDARLWDVYSEILGRVAALPGVIAVGMGEEVPVSGGYGCVVQGFEDASIADRIRESGLTTCAGQIRVTPGYFDALGIPLLDGRLIDAGDIAEPTRGSVVVSRAFADRFWPGENPIGKGIGPNGRNVPPFYRVVGVVGDVAKSATEGRPPLSETAIAVYYPVVANPEATGWGGWWPGNVTLVARGTADDPSDLYPAVRGAIAAIGPDIPLEDPRSLEDVVDRATAQVAFVSLLLAIAAVVALTLAAVGLYGVVAYVVSRRTREIGTRLAIGARPEAVVRDVVGGTLRLVAAGLALGIPLALLTSRVGRSLLVGVAPTAPSAYAAAAALLTVVAFAASWLPARRAARVDPITALRAE